MHGRGKFVVLIPSADGGSVTEAVEDGTWENGVLVPPVSESPGKPGSAKKKKK